MQVREINKEQLEKYNKLQSELGGIFNSYSWKENVHGGALKYFGIYEDDGQLVGAFHLYFKKYLWMTFIKNPPYVPHIGLIFNNRSSNPANALSFTKKITELVSEYISSLSPSVLSIALPPVITDTQAFFWKKFKVIPNYTYQLNLSQTEDEIEKRFSPEHRNSFKKAMKENVEVKPCADYKVVKGLIMNTFDRKSESVSEETIDKILFNFAGPENSFAFVAYHEGKAIAASFCLFDKNMAYYLLGGYDNNSKHQGAGIACVYNSILNAKRKDLKIFDFEGSMIKEVERYFRSFGPDLVPYYTINKAKLPFELVLKFIKRQLF
jgi:hypothetical protein